jgi:RNA polymerase sigma factor (sigma-70 family)
MITKEREAEEGLIDERKLIKNFKAGTTTFAEQRFLVKWLKRFIYKNHRKMAYEADDLAIDALLEAYEDIDSLRDIAKFFGWLSTITTRVVIKRATYVKEHPTLSREDSPVLTNEMCPAEIEALSNMVGFTDSDEDMLRKWALEGALAKLTEEERTVIHLRRAEQLTSDEVAVQTGKSAPAVRQMELRALRKLFNLLVENGDWDSFVTKQELLQAQSKSPKATNATAPKVPHN